MIKYWREVSWSYPLWELVGENGDKVAQYWNGNGVLKPSFFLGHFWASCPYYGWVLGNYNPSTYGMVYSSCLRKCAPKHLYMCGYLEFEQIMLWLYLYI
jgi:hypothetical protein